jgi:hypothetical protein
MCNQRAINVAAKLWISKEILKLEETRVSRKPDTVVGICIQPWLQQDRGSVPGEKTSST